MQRSTNPSSAAERGSLPSRTAALASGMRWTSDAICRRWHLHLFLLCSSPPHAQAVVLACEDGRRLYPLTQDCPAPLLPVLNKPLLAYQLELLENAGYTGVCVCVCWCCEYGLGRVLLKGGVGWNVFGATFPPSCGRFPRRRPSLFPARLPTAEKRWCATYSGREVGGEYFILVAAGGRALAVPMLCWSGCCGPV